MGIFMEENSYKICHAQWMSVVRTLLGVDKNVLIRYVLISVLAI